MKVLFVAGREIGYPRNRVILRALQHAGCEVKVIASEGKTYASRLPRVTLEMLREALWKDGEPDLYLVGFLGHTLLPFLRPLTRRPLVFDPFVSLHETLCEDRRRVKPGGIASRFLARLDAWTCGAADMVLVDTQVHADYYAATFNQPRSKFVRLWVGADDGLFFPRDRTPKDDGNFVKVFYYATFQPLHGVEVVLDAAEEFSAREGILFRLVGKGPELPRLQERLEKMARKGILSWQPWASEGELAELIADSDICLGGHFSLRPKADRVIPGKIYQFMAMRKPVIAGDSRANRELLVPGESALLVPRGDPRALAEGVEYLAREREERERLAENAYGLFKRSCSPEALAVDLRAALERLCG